MIILDYNAITPISNEVFLKLSSFIQENLFLNPSSVHTLGKKSKQILESCKKKIEQSLLAKCHNIYFVSCGTEANNMALKSQNFEKIFTVKTEHESILRPIEHLNHQFIEINNNGIIDLNHLEEEIKKLSSSNFLCSVMLANNESGVIQKINKIAEIVHNYGGILHSDISQFITKQEFNFSIYNIDIATFSGNKIYSGLGGGVAIFKSEIDVKPLILGGGQQNYKRAGTENLSQIFCITEALTTFDTKKFILKTSKFQKMLEEDIIKNEGNVFAINENRISNTSLIKMPNVNNFTQLMEFDLNEICIGIGSACSSGRTQVSHVLTSCGVKEEEAKNYIRISTSHLNKIEEIKCFLDVWKKLKIRNS